MPHIDSAIHIAATALKRSGVESPWLDAELLLAYTLKKERSWLLAHGEYPLSRSQRKRFTRLITRRARRIPLAYLTGAKEFYGRQFRVTRAVLIPRPETEELIDLVIPHLQKIARGSLVADIGTGSGCIGITLARAFPHLRFTATDASPRALAVARANARRHRVARRIRFVLDSTFSLLKNKNIAAIVANLPYLSLKELKHVQPELQREPRRALVAGPRADECIRALLQAIAAKSLGNQISCVALEINPRHSRSLARFASQKLPKLSWTIASDLGHAPRFLLGINNKPSA